jgi:hypothetical protein
MSHPVEISRRCNLNISRRRRRIRLRRTAFPNAFLMLQPNRLSSRPLGRTNIVNSRLLRRRPSRYTASYSARRTSRVSRGRSSRGRSDAREGVAPFFPACGKDFSSTLGLHAFAEAVFLVTAAHMRLISAFRQRKSPLNFSARSLIRSAPESWGPKRAIALRLRRSCTIRRIAHPDETRSLDDPRHNGQGIAPRTNCRRSTPQLLASPPVLRDSKTHSHPPAQIPLILAGARPSVHTPA